MADKADSGKKKLTLDIDYKTLIALLPAALALIGKVTKKDDKGGHFEFEKKSDSGNILGYILDLVGDKSGGTTVELSAANDTKEEKSGLGDILSTLGKLGKLTGGDSKGGGDLMSMLGSLTGSGSDSKSKEKDKDLTSMLGDLL